MRKTCLNEVFALAKNDKRVLYLGSDPGPGTLDDMKAELPGQFLIEGISEANVIGMAAGLAMEGFIPYMNTIASFITRRAFEQIAIDVALHDLPVRFIGNGGGFVYAPLGPTHTDVEDIALMRTLPNMAVVAVSDASEMTAMMQATKDWPHPLYIRLGKGGDPVIFEHGQNFELGKGHVYRTGDDVLIASTGVMTHRALQAAEKLAENNIKATVLHLATIKPLDCKSLKQLAQGKKLVVTLEEHALIGGLGSAVAECYVDAQHDAAAKMLRLGVPDRFTHNYGSQDSLLDMYGLQPDGIAKSVLDNIKS